MANTTASPTKQGRLSTAERLTIFVIVVLATILSPLNGVGQSISVAAVGPTRVDYGAQMSGTTSGRRMIILTNAGVDPMPVKRVALTGDFVSVNECPSLLAAGKECRIWISFKPSAEGVRVGYLTIIDDAGTQAVVLVGKGTPVLNASRK
jgi:hypothetical protein